MGQLKFYKPFNYILNNAGNAGWLASHQSVSFVPFNFNDNISLLTLNINYRQNHSSSNSIYVGLYSLNQSSLSLANSLSGTVTISIRHMLSLTNTSVAQNITPGTWWFGLLVSTIGSSAVTFGGLSHTVNPSNAFPGGFVQGDMTVSTNQLPTSVATSDLDTTGAQPMGRALYIIMTA